MATSLLANASEASAIVIGLIPALIGTFIVGGVLYAVTLWIFLEKKSLLWRLSGFILAALFAFIGIAQSTQLEQKWETIHSVFLIVFLFPMLSGLVAEYLLRKKQRVS